METPDRKTMERVLLKKHLEDQKKWYEEKLKYMPFDDLDYAYRLAIHIQKHADEK